MSKGTQRNPRQFKIRELIFCAMALMHPRAHILLQTLKHFIQCLFSAVKAIIYKHVNMMSQVITREIQKKSGCFFETQFTTYDYEM